MKNKIFEVTPVQLNTGNVIEVDVVLEITVPSPDGAGNSRLDTLYPLQVRIENTSGQGINFNVLDDEDEYEEYQAGANYYAMLPVLDGKASVNNMAQRVYRILIQKIGGGAATGNVSIYCVNYVARGR